jgi:hypothetical protein
VVFGVVDRIFKISMYQKQTSSQCPTYKYR